MYLGIISNIHVSVSIYKLMNLRMILNMTQNTVVRKPKLHFLVKVLPTFTETPPKKEKKYHHSFKINLFPYTIKSIPIPFKEK